LEECPTTRSVPRNAFWMVGVAFPLLAGGLVALGLFGIIEWSTVRLLGGVLMVGLAPVLRRHMQQVPR